MPSAIDPPAEDWAALALHVAAMVGAESDGALQEPLPASESVPASGGVTPESAVPESAPESERLLAGAADPHASDATQTTASEMRRGFMSRRVYHAKARTARPVPTEVH